MGHLLTVQNVRENGREIESVANDLVARLNREWSSTAKPLGLMFVQAAIQVVVRMSVGMDHAHLVDDSICQAALGLLAELGKPAFGDVFPILRRFDHARVKASSDMIVEKAMELIAVAKSGDAPAHALIPLSLSSSLTDDEVVAMIRDLLLGGGDTTGVTLKWFFTFMVRASIQGQSGFAIVEFSNFFWSSRPSHAHTCLYCPY